MKIQLILILVALIIAGKSQEGSGQFNEEQQIKNQQKSDFQIMQNDSDLQNLAEKYQETLNFIIGPHHFQGFYEEAQKKFNRKNDKSLFEIMKFINKQSHEFVKKQFDGIIKDYKLLMNSQQLLGILNIQNLNGFYKISCQFNNFKETEEFQELLTQTTLKLLNIREPNQLSEDSQKLEVIFDLYNIIFGEETVDKIINESYEFIMDTYQTAKEYNNGVGDRRDEFYDSSIFKEGMTQQFRKNILTQLKEYGIKIKDMSYNLQIFQKQVLAELAQRENELKEEQKIKNQQDEFNTKIEAPESNNQHQQPNQNNEQQEL
ncbi:hypothetical protein PPERSA_06794 [Pseudocohnilembus persalinus]|uniref:Transmembrane protein n=1 Tax=Pseudocohnilembus persalinus TaxID=266149 RepID=A0A0V0QTB3_PSEPJ|nr:hypothetical protein PPERSA_06794 [Pseudocohnilembus persalinus]|eukprot:KRX05160.1 hypothetical protein PPERSA_06794 [Pseudocohnilembus persalinus]